MLIVDVEEVSHEAPPVPKHLGPLFCRLDPDAHVAQRESAIRAGRWRSARGGRTPGRPGSMKDRAAIVRHRRRGDPGRVLGGLAILETVPVHRHAGLVRHGLRHEHVAAGRREEAGVVPHGHIRCWNDPTGDARHIDRDGDVLVTSILGSVVGLLVAPRQERRRSVGVEDGHVQRPGHGAVVRRHVEPTGVESVVGRGQEIQIVTRRVPDRRDGVRHPVGELMPLTRLCVVRDDHPELRIEPARVGDEARIRRPHGIHGALGVSVAVRVHVLDTPRRHVHDEDAVVGVGERQLAAVRRPPRLEVERRLGHRNRSLIAPELVGDDQLVFAGRVVEPRHLRAVGGPDRSTVGDPGSPREIPPASLVHGHGEDVSAVLEHGALAGRGESRIRQLCGRDVLPAGAGPVLVAGSPDLELTRRAGGRIEFVQISSLLVDHDAVTSVEAHHVEVGVERQLPITPRRRIVRPYIARPVALGHVVDGAVHPRRIEMPLTLPRGMLEVEGFRGHDPDRLRLPTPVVPPAGVPELNLLVGVVRAVVAQLALVCLVKPRPNRESPLRTDRVEGPETGGNGVAPGPEEDVSLGRPSLHDVRRRMPCEPFRLST